METLNHLLGICGETHINIYSIIFVLIILKLIYEKNTIKTFWNSSWWNS